MLHTDTEILDFPYAHYSMSKEDLMKLFRELPTATLGEKWINKELSPMIKLVPEIKNMARPGCWVTGDIITFAFGDAENKFFNLTSYFTEQCKLICRRGTELETPLEIFMRERPRMARRILERGEKLSADTIYQEFKYLNTKPCSEFNPAWLVQIIKFLRAEGYEIHRMLDMSAGRASRMIACMSLGVDYVGTDPNDCVPYADIAKFYKAMGKAGNTAVVHINGFLECKELDGEAPFDLMFSSPPYFDVEIYSTAAEDSVKQNPSMDGWLENFMLPSMNRISRLLRPGGIMAINIDNPLFQDKDYVSPILKHSMPDMTYIGMFNIFTKLYFSTWCWQKK